MVTVERSESLTGRLVIFREGLPTICQANPEGIVAGGFAPATPGFNAFGQTGAVQPQTGLFPPSYVLAEFIERRPRQKA